LERARVREAARVKKEGKEDQGVLDTIESRITLEKLRNAKERHLTTSSRTSSSSYIVLIILMSSPNVNLNLNPNLTNDIRSKIQRRRRKRL